MNPEEQNNLRTTENISTASYLSLHDLYPPEWETPAESVSGEPDRHRQELHRYKTSVFHPPEIPFSLAEHSELGSIAERAPYQYDELLLSGRKIEERQADRITERIFERAMVVSSGRPWSHERMSASVANDNHRIYQILSRSEVVDFLMPHFRELQAVRGEEQLPGTLKLWESQFTRMGYSGRFQFIGKHDHSDIGDLVTVNLLKVSLEWGDHGKHGHVIEIEEGGSLRELRVPATTGDFIIESAEVNHRVPKLRDRESRRISLASVWRFTPDKSVPQKSTQ